jgi:hypothetical protein
MTRVGWGTINVVRSAQQNESHSASYTMSCVSDQSDAVRAMRPAKLECPTVPFCGAAREWRTGDGDSTVFFLQITFCL